MQITVKSAQVFQVFHLKGRLDHTCSPELKSIVKEHLNEGKVNILLNLAQVDFIDSSGLGTLISTLKEVRRANGKIALCNLSPYVQEIFEITQLTHIFDIFPGENEALAAFGHRKVAAAN